MDTSGIEPDPSRKLLMDVLSERDNQLHHVPSSEPQKDTVSISGGDEGCQLHGTGSGSFQVRWTRVCMPLESEDAY
jgi:hypothetical protein